ncbi:unnamed protein product [Diplocarpon coronariae]|uniref:Uncharacterized protein n=1 Tax=Diplocarpon coronariae TaxID=2795749 RepID=A0A218ZBX4_9HELO|nr:hypothetical protein JHW43_000423 [Diplocarpon mali]OWP04785.1 hypothetical protein B2J93_4067 [Marssonina coronariae]
MAAGLAAGLQREAHAPASTADHQDSQASPRVVAGQNNKSSVEARGWGMTAVAPRRSARRSARRWKRPAVQPSPPPGAPLEIGSAGDSHVGEFGSGQTVLLTCMSRGEA